MPSNTYITAQYSFANGITSNSPFVELFMERDPTTNDINYPIQKRWLNIDSGTEWILIGYTSFEGILQADWLSLGSGGGGGGSFTWHEIVGSTQNLVANNGYITNSATVTYLLPATSALGDTIKLITKSGTTVISQNAGQSIVIGNKTTTVGSGGSLTSIKNGDSLELICTTSGADSVFTVDDSIGNWIVV